MFWAWPLLGNLKPALISWPLGGSGKQAIYTELTYYHLVKLKYQNTIANMYLHTQQTRRHSLGVVFQSNIYFPFLFFLALFWFLQLLWGMCGSLAAMFLN